jgi:hypothetical protein
MFMKAMAAIGSAAFAGVMLTIGLGLGSFFLLAEPSVFVDWFWLYFWFFLGPVGLTSIPAFIGSIAMLRRSQQGSAQRRLWKISLGGLIATYAITAVVHLPLNITFWFLDLSDTQITTNLYIWMAFHFLRVATALIAAIYAYRAVTGPSAPARPAHDRQGAKS